jgi:hypothetical protein
MNAHGADEWLDLASLVPTAKVLGAFMPNWCGVKWALRPNDMSLLDAI